MYYFKKPLYIDICDDFDMDKIINSGQCFRAKRIDDECCRFITGSSVMYIKEAEPHRYMVSCTEDEWETVWEPYFDLGRSYNDIIENERGKNSYVDKTMEFGRGLRILRQDPWETLITFIISQRKSIPAIAKSVEALARSFGDYILKSDEHGLTYEASLSAGNVVDSTESLSGGNATNNAVELIAEYFGALAAVDYKSCCSFPTPQQLAAASADELGRCSLGYRTPYVMDAAWKVASGELDLEAIAGHGSEELLLDLQSVYGVGKKVANCVALFAYGRMECAPVDVWIARAIDEEFGGSSPFPMYGENAGIVQQYIFYYKNPRSRAVSER